MSRFSTVRDLLAPQAAPARKRPTALSARHHVPDRTLAYGPHPLQQVDLFVAPDTAAPDTGTGPRPLVVFIHGGAWRFGDKARRLRDHKAAFCRAEHWHFASVNFRMVPEVGVGEMAADVALALAALAAQPGVDPARIVVMGHSSGAHLAALAATDPALPCPPLAGVIANDGAAYDAHQPSVGSAWLARSLIDPAFPPHDPHALAALSPAVHAALAPAPPFLILHAARRSARRQAEWLEQALVRGGTPVARHPCGGGGLHGHVMLSRKFGLPGFPATEIARQWLRGLFAGG